MKILSAEWVLPMSSAPIEKGAVAIDGAKILAAGTISEITERFPEAAREDFGAAAILGGFSGLRAGEGFISGEGFAVG